MRSQVNDSFWGIIPSGGSGTRAGASIPKQYVEIAGQTILQHAVDALATHPRCAGIVIAADPQWHEQILRMLEAVEIPTILVEGGARRQDSVHAGLRALPSEVDVILVHDAARPALSNGVIDRVLAGVEVADLVIPGLPVVDTLKRVDISGMVLETVDRDAFRTVQTPQGVRRSTLSRAFEIALRDEISVTDEAGLVELTGGRVLIVEGDSQNLKVTRPEDFRTAEQYLLNRS